MSWAKGTKEGMTRKPSTFTVLNHCPVRFVKSSLRRCSFVGLSSIKARQKTTDPDPSGNLGHGNQLCLSFRHIRHFLQFRFRANSRIGCTKFFPIRAFQSVCRAKIQSTRAVSSVLRAIFLIARANRTLIRAAYSSSCAESV